MFADFVLIDIRKNHLDWKLLKKIHNTLVKLTLLSQSAGTSYEKNIFYPYHSNKDYKIYMRYIYGFESILERDIEIDYCSSEI